MHDVSLLRPLHAPTDTVMNTTEELRNVTTQYAVGSKAAQLHLVLSSSWEASPDVIIYDTREGSKKRHKQCY
jgi:hypothetical protein